MALLGGQVDANKGHAFGIFMTLVGTLRTFGAPVPLTFDVRPHQQDHTHAIHWSPQGLER